jgi:GrpB-like predicted nucleotidyltransferase (UPF0157 family)
VNPDLARRLEAVGIGPEAIEDPAAAWRTLAERSDEEVTLFDRYAIEAAALGVDLAQLSGEQRRRLAFEFNEWRFPGFEMAGEYSGHPIHVVEYRESWPVVFEDWRGRLASVLEAALRIEHIGSTAVPGLAAKPVVDIQVSVPDLENEDAYLRGVESTGVRLRARHHDDRYFRPPPNRPRVVQIHVCEGGGPWERDHLLFRDYLRAEPGTRDEYEALKRRLADEYRDDRIAYTEAKTPFIRDAMARAAVWAAETRWSVGDS